MLKLASLALLTILAACGGDSGPTPIDAPGQADASSSPSVRSVTCPSGTVPTVTTADSNTTSYTPPSVSINVGGIVKFVMSPSHNVMPNPIRSTDAGLRVDFGATTCLEFAKAGTFGFMCAAHGFAGTVVVQ